MKQVISGTHPVLDDEGKQNLVCSLSKKIKINDIFVCGQCLIFSNVFLL